MQCAEAIDAAHDEGLVHGNLQPSDILLRTDGARLHVNVCGIGFDRVAARADDIRALARIIHDLCSDPLPDLFERAISGDFTRALDYSIIFAHRTSARAIG